MSGMQVFTEEDSNTRASASPEPESFHDDSTPIPINYDEEGYLHNYQNEQQQTPPPVQEVIVDIDDSTNISDLENDGIDEELLQYQRECQFRKRAWRRRILLDAHGVWNDTHCRMKTYMQVSEIRKLRTSWARTTLKWVGESLANAFDDDDDAKLLDDYRKYLKQCHAFAQGMVERHRSKKLADALAINGRKSAKKA